MSDSPIIPLIFLSVRGACHLLIFLRIFTYTAHGSGKHRKGVGLIAAVFAGLNLVEAIRIISALMSPGQVGEDLYLPGQMLFITAFIFWANGNIARFVPSKILRRLP